MSLATGPAQGPLDEDDRRERRRRRNWLLIGGSLILIVLGRVASAPRPEPTGYFTEVRLPLVIAHQGGDGHWPGNTMYAFRRAAQVGVDVLEMDVHRSSDGVLVLSHDATVDRTTNGSGRIDEQTWAALERLDAGYHWPAGGGGERHARAGERPFRGRGIRMARLDEVVRAFPDVRLNIEIKPDDAATAGALCELLRSTGAGTRTLVASFHADAMAAFREACPEVATSAPSGEVRMLWVLSRIRLPQVVTPVAQAMQVPEHDGDLHVADAGFIAAAHRVGQYVDIWTVNEPDDMRRLVEAGVDGLITDVPVDAMRALGRPLRLGAPIGD